MIFWVERSGENPDLAAAETAGVVRSLGGKVLRERTDRLPERFVRVDLAGTGVALELARRLALAHRVLAPWPESGVDSLRARAATEARERPRPLSIDWLVPPGPAAAGLRAAVADAYVAAGGSIRPATAERRYYLWGDEGPGLGLAELVARVDRTAYERRRMPRLPFQRPVSLPPRQARAAANLAGIGPGLRVADPFVGTGALLLEAGLLGARLFGSDRDAGMIRGALGNLAAVGLGAEALIVGDAAAAVDSLPWPEVDVVLTDPPYGRASSTGGEESGELIRRVLPRWADRTAAGGRIVLIGPAGPDPLPPPWVRTVSVPHRVHRSLTREFRVYERLPASGPR
jgi:hypothetical protein